MLKYLFSLVIAASLLAGAQTAKVVPLSSEDAARVKALFAEQKRVESDLAEIRTRIAQKYIVEPQFHLSASSWSTAFEYSEDFKFIIPAMVRPFSPDFQVIGCQVPTPSIGTLTTTRDY